ncbi:unnamed protein product, partial [Symbiodinium sp. KB8]
MSAAGKRLKRAGETNAVYIAHGRFVTAKRTPLLLVECTKDLDMGMLEDTHPDHDFYQMFSEPSDFGYRGLSRFRTWVVGSHREKSTCLHDPFELLENLKSAFSELPGAGVSDFLVASEAELHLEAAALARRRKKAVPSLKNLSGLLNVRELLCKQQLDDKYLNQRGQHPSRNPNLVYYLGDSAEYCTWSAKSDKIPTYRLGARSGLYWLPGQGRWLTSKAMDVPVLGATDIQRASDLRSELYLLSPRAGPGTGTRDRESDMACTLLGQVGEHGEDLLAAEPAPSDIDNSVSARGSKKPKAVKEPKARAKKNEVATLSTSFTCWRKDTHIKDFMSLAEPTKCSLSFLNSLGSRTIRAGFFGMFRFVKADQAKLLIDEYDRLGRPMTHCTLVELIQKTEIELSKNHTFKLLTLSGGEAMLECKGVVKPLGAAPAGGHWMIKYAKGIPFVTDSNGTVKKWCMSVFQQDSCESAEAARPPMDICIHKVTGDESGDEAPAPTPPKPKQAGPEPIQTQQPPGPAGQTPAGTPRLGVKSVEGPETEKNQDTEVKIPVCHCNKRLPQCSTCGKGYDQEVQAGRIPRFLTRKEFEAAEAALMNSSREKPQDAVPTGAMPPITAKDNSGSNTDAPPLTAGPKLEQASATKQSEDDEELQLQKAEEELRERKEKLKRKKEAEEQARQEEAKRLKALQDEEAAKQEAARKAEEDAKAAALKAEEDARAAALKAEEDARAAEEEAQRQKLIEEQRKKEEEDERLRRMAEQLATQMFQKLQTDYADKMSLEQAKLTKARAEAEEQTRLAKNAEKAALETQAALKSSVDAKLEPQAEIACPESSESGSGSGGNASAQATADDGKASEESVSLAAQAPVTTPVSTGASEPPQQAVQPPALESKAGKEAENTDKNQKRAA